GVVLPAHADIQGQVGPQLPIVLHIRVVLMRARLDGGILCGFVLIGIEVRDEALTELRGNPGELHDSLLQTINIGSVRRCRGVAADGTWDIQETALPRTLVKERPRRQDRAAEETAAVVVDVETEVDAGMEGVRPVKPAQVVNELWRRHAAL